MTNRPDILAASDQEIEAAVDLADPMVLRGLLYLQTGDENIASIRVTSTTVHISDVMTVAEESDVMLLRQRAAAFLRKYRDDGAPELDLNNNPRLSKSIALTFGEAITARDIDLWREELALNPWARGLEWPNTPEAKQLEEFSVLVVGAGMVGLNAAIQLKRAGFTFTVIEKNSSVGGTWLKNRYPGCRVDTQSRGYTLLCGADYHHPYTYSPQAENEKYLNWIADKFEVRPHIQFDTEVSSMVWDEAARRWTVRASGPDGEQVWHPNAVITAVGLFNRPNVPDFPGRDEFAGIIVHTAQWPAGLKISGKRVAVVGAGCSGYQAFPEIARQAAHTYLFQNTPSWVFEAKSYLTPLPHGVNWLERNFPYYHNFLRARERWLLGPATLDRIFAKDPAVSEKLRSQRLAFIGRKLGSRPDLAAKMTPNYPPNASRPVIVDEDYSVYDVLLQGNSSLITDGIERLTARGVVDKVGNEHAVDVLVLATGFKVDEFLAPMDVVGRNGITLSDLWSKDGPRAYLGTHLPGFPNFFMLYGPNTNGGGIPAVFEATTRYALRCLAELVLRPASTVTVTEEAYRQYNAELDEADKQKIWNDSGVSNYFTGRYGRSAVMQPFSAFQMWQWFRDPSGEYALRDLGPSHNEGSLVRPYFGADLVVQ